MKLLICHVALATVPFAVDLDPPKAGIGFPLPSALTDADSIRVRGTARDADGVASVRVNGILASTVNGFAHWWVVVPLELGENELVVETLDLAGNLDPSAARTTVRRDGVIVRRPEGLALDPARNTCFIFDWVPDGLMPLTLTRIVAWDLASGALWVVSSRSKGSGPLPRYASAEMEYDPVARRLLLVDGTLNALLAVDPATGDRSVVSGDTVGAGPPLQGVIGLELDPHNGAAWVFNQSFSATDGALLGVDLTSGARWVVSSPSVGSGPWPQHQRFMQRIEGGDRLLVTCYLDDLVLGIDLDSGDRSIVADASAAFGKPWSHLWDVVALPQGRAWVSSAGDGRLFAFDPSSGVSATIAAPPAGEEGCLMGLELDAAQNRLLAADDKNAAILAVDLASGAVDVALRNSIGGGVAFRRGMTRGTAVNASGRALVVDPYMGELVAVNLIDGVRTLISGGGLGSGPDLAQPVDVEFDESTGTTRALLLDPGLGGIVAVDLVSGDRSVISGGGVGAGPPFQLQPWSTVSMDVEGDTAWVMDSATDLFGNRLLAVDLSSGDRTLVSGDGIGSGRPLFDSEDVAIDAAGGRALTFSMKDLVSIDLASGNRSVLSGSTVGSGPALGDPVLVAWDDVEGRALVYGRLAGLTAVDGATGNRVRLAQSDASKGTGLAWPMSMALWRPLPGAEPILLLGDHELTALCAFDLAFDPLGGDVPAWRAIVAR